MKNFIICKKKCVYAIYYEVYFQNKGKMKLWIDKDNPKELFITDLYVNENFRKQGIGQKLLNYSIKAAKKLGHKKIALRVFSGSWMEFWYRKNGFVFDYVYEEDKLMTYLHKNII